MHTLLVTSSLSVNKLELKGKLRRKNQNMRFIIILGTGNMRSLRTRVETAVNELKKKPWKTEFWHDSNTLISSVMNTTIIFSGRSPEAERMRDHAKDLINDFPDEYLVLENKSFSTVENLLNSRGIMKEYQGMCRGEGISVTVVSSAFHIPRVQILCDKILSEFKTDCVGTEEPVTEFRRNREEQFMAALRA